MKIIEKAKASLKKRRESRNKEYSKIILSRIINCCLIFMFLSYVLAFLGMDDIAEYLSSAIATTTIVTCVGYFAKSGVENISKYTDAFGKNIYTPSEYEQMKSKIGETTYIDDCRAHSENEFPD